MRKIVIVLMLMASSAFADELPANETFTLDHSLGANDSLMSVSACQNQWKDLPKLAERLGVEPNTGQATILLSLCDGRRYDLIALVNAFLDKMDANARP